MDLGIHLHNGLFQIVEVIARVVMMIDKLYCDVSGGEVETSSLWQCQLYFLVFKIKTNSEGVIFEMAKLWCMEEWSFEGFMQLMIALIIRGIHMD